MAPRKGEEGYDEFLEKQREKRAKKAEEVRSAKARKTLAKELRAAKATANELDQVTRRSNKHMIALNKAHRDLKQMTGEKAAMKTENAALKRKLARFEAHVEQTVKQRVAAAVANTVATARLDVSRAQKEAAAAVREKNTAQQKLLEVGSLHPRCF